MTNSQHVGGKQRHRRQRQTRSPSPSEPSNWEQIQRPALDYLTYRTRSRAADVDIQMPDSVSRRERHSASSSHRGRRASEDREDRETMPLPTSLHRSRPVTNWRGKEPQVYEEDEELSASLERQPRPRVRHRARSNSRSTFDSERSRSRSEALVTPSRAARVRKYGASDFRPLSRSASSRRAPSVDSASTLSAETQNEVKELLRRPPAELQVMPDAEKPGHRHRHRHRHDRGHRDFESAPYQEEPSRKSRRTVPIISDSRDGQRRHNRHHSESRSSSRRRHHEHHAHGEDVIKPSNSKRSYQKHYKSDTSYVDRPKLLRSPSSHITSTHSVSTSSRRSSTAISKFVYGTTKPTKLVECVACLDEEVPSNKAAKLKCKHHMCHSCMKRVFKVSIKDPQHMPPKCCTEDPIPVKHVDRLFDTSFKKTWNKKFAEYSTRNRIYCPRKRCGEWIKPSRVRKLRDGRKIAECGSCNQEVCCACNGKWHNSKDCPRDAATNAILEQAKEFGWQRCYGCREMVELKEGCNHMTCRCGTEFCMICAAKWKSCECPWFNDETVDSDQPEYTTTPSHSRAERERLSIRDSRRHNSRPRMSTTYDEDLTLRRAQEQHDEEYARQLQYEDDDDDDNDDDDDHYVETHGDIVGIGNSAGHLMNDDYRRAPRVIPAVPSPPMQAVDRANGGDYVTGVNKARGVRASSMERRLADRFSDARQGTSPTHRSFTTPIAPGPPPGMGLGMSGMAGMSPPPPHPPMSVPFMMPRAHTMDEDMMYGSPDIYSSPPRSRLSERIAPGRGWADYEAEPPAYTHVGRRRHGDRERDAPRHSALAGLTGPGSGVNRVSEWMNYVPRDPEYGLSAT